MTNLNEVFEGKPFNYVSLFSGIGGSCVMASEIDKYANQAYEVLYGHSTVGDVTKVAAEDVPDHDLLVGGFPCPTFSVAGGRDGMEYQCEDCGHEHLITYNDYKNGVKCPMCGGKTEPKDIRGLLFFEIARIADDKQPKVLLLENVKGLVSSAGGEVLRVIVETLNQIGYTVDFEVMNSKYFGVPQNRERIFIVAVRNDLIEPVEWNVGKRSDVVAKGKRRIKELGVKTFNFDWPTQESVMVRLRDILESDVDDKFYLSEEKTAKLVAQLEERGLGGQTTLIDPKQAKREGAPRFYSEVAPTVTARDYKEPNMVGHIDLKGHDAIKRVYDPEGISPTLTTMGGGHREPKIAIEAKMAEIASPDNLSYCIDANYTKGIAPSGVGKGRRTHVEETSPRYRIRKLTPRECFRLQGFPDAEFDKLTANGISNSQLYKMAGNAVTVNVISALGRRLLRYIGE